MVEKKEAFERLRVNAERRKKHRLGEQGRLLNVLRSFFGKREKESKKKKLVHVRESNTPSFSSIDLM
jgi:hypothetical protein